MGVSRKDTVSRFLSSFFDSAARHVRTVFRRLQRAWAESIQFRIVVSAMATIAIAITLVGIMLQVFLVHQLTSTKTSSALEEMNRAHSVVADQVNASDVSNSLSVRLSSIRSVLTQENSRSGRVNSFYDAVLMAPNADGVMVKSPDALQDSGVRGDDIPLELQRYVQSGHMATQFSTLNLSQGTSKVLVVGAPVESSIRGLELYLIFPLNNEETTFNLIRGLLFIFAAILVLILVGIIWFFTNKVTMRLAQAARVAERLSSGHLHERLPVTGEDEMAKLAVSFNKMAKSLSDQINSLEEYGSLQRRFTSDVSHELRTPLTTVRMAADMLDARKENLDPPIERSVTLMVRELDRFESLLYDLLEISRHDAGEAHISYEQIDIRGIVVSSLQQLSAVAQKVSCPMIVDMPEEAVLIEVDTKRVERIVRNLLANAIDHSEQRPVITRLAVDENSVAISVADHGVGLRPGDAQLVFNRFWRADPSRERRTGGTGLGLAIAQEDAKLHDGYLEAAGEEGKGSCFRLTLPRIRGHKLVSSPLPLRQGLEMEQESIVGELPYKPPAVPLDSHERIFDPYQQILLPDNQEDQGESDEEEQKEKEDQTIAPPVFEDDLLTQIEGITEAELLVAQEEAAEMDMMFGEGETEEESRE